MTSKPSMPVWIAVLINANIVIGSAFFLGAPLVVANAGLLAPLAWILCGLLLLPLVIALAQLSTHYPTAGGLYVYSKERLGTLWGFISGWGYFIGASAGNAVVIHAFSIHFQQIPTIAPILKNVGIYGLPFDILLILLFTALNLKNIDFLEKTQVLFSVLKAIPFALILVATPILFNIHNITFAQVKWSGLINSFPLVLFAYIGIEACCAIADKIENGKRNAARVILISFGMIVGIYAVTQLFLLGIHGTAQANPFFAIMPMLTRNATVIEIGNALVYVALLSSFLAGFYGMFYFNNWNLYAIAKEGNLPFSRQITRLNKNQSPITCILVQSALVIAFVVMAQHGDYVITMSDFGTMIAYLLSTLALLNINRSKIGKLSLVSCAVLLYLATQNLAKAGWHYVIPFGIILVAGLALHLAARRAKPAQ